MVCDVALVPQTTLGTEARRSTDPPAQKVVEDSAVRVGTAGTGFTVIAKGVLTDDEHPLATARTV
jgi:hypothetical protein